MQPVLNVEDVRRVEEALTKAGVSVSELMHRAGAALAHEVLRMEDVHEVAVLAGLGNNGGDGWVAADELKRRGFSVTVVSPAEIEDIHSDLARVCALAAHKAGVGVMVAPPRDQLDALLARVDVVIDAMLGTGFQGSARPPFNVWIDAVNASGARVVSADVPSGLSAQRGVASGPCVSADITVTMLVLKPGLLADDGRDACGSIVVAPLAEQTERLVREADPVAWRPDLDDYLDVMVPQSSAVDKFSRGSVLVVGGSTRYPGAPMMAALAAARAGAGYVTLAVPAAIAGLVQAHMMEIPVIAFPADADGCFSTRAHDLIESLAKKCDVTLVGPGMRVSGSTVSIISSLLTVDKPLVIDADGLNCLARLTSNRLDEFPELIRRKAPLVLTPHRRELGRLVGLSDTPPDSLTATLEAARRIAWADGGSELCIVAKGSATACVSPESALLPKPGPAALATAGSGDVLGGIIAAQLATTKIGTEGLPLLSALACEIHGQAGAIAAGRFGSRGVMATDVIDAIGLAADAIEEQVALLDVPTATE